MRRILTETDIFVKYGLIERAAEHVRKVFEPRPEHTGAHERLIAILIQLGRKAEAVEELGILADRLLSQPTEAAADGTCGARSSSTPRRPARATCSSG